jgi:hypothetical protein
MVRRHIAGLGSIFLVMLVMIVFAGTQANAGSVHFRYTGGRWSHSRHVGWHHYWGGPTIGFYWAPTPVYIVPGYTSVRYYSGPDYWYSNPSFGLSINIGGGGPGFHRGRDYHYVDNDRYRYRRNPEGFSHSRGGRESGSRFDGGSRSRRGGHRR